MIYLLSGLCLVLLTLLVIALKREARGREALQKQAEAGEVRQKKSGNSHQREIGKVLDAMPHPFFSFSILGEVLRTNTRADEIFQDRAVIGRRATEVFMDSELNAVIEDAIQGGGPQNYSIKLPPSSSFSVVGLGEASFWEIDVTRVTFEDQQTEIYLMMRDVTTAMNADRVRKDFVANASHELRTPLSIISGYLENLTEEDGLRDTETARSMLETMSRHVIRINALVEDMLTISKLESEEAAPLNLTEFLLKTCLADVVEQLEPMIMVQEAKVKVKVGEVKITGDQFYWTQILFNLIENALKQNTCAPLTIKVDAVERDGEVVINIRDNGIGIPAADLPYIFKRFYRVEKHHSQNQIKGTGLGLSIVKRAVEAHGGMIVVRSTPGTETVFELRLPSTTS